ncbi:6865_t:CDS:2, partial [Gigaspora rosea]
FHESIDNNSEASSATNFSLEDQQKNFEQLLLQATVSYGWAFSWIENSE